MEVVADVDERLAAFWYCECPTQPCLHAKVVFHALGGRPLRIEPLPGETWTVDG